MHKLARFADARNTFEGKVLSVLLAILLAFSMLNTPAYAGQTGTTEGRNDSAPVAKQADERISESEAPDYDPLLGPAAELEDEEVADPESRDDEERITVLVSIEGIADLYYDREEAYVDGDELELIVGEEAKLDIYAPDATSVTVIAYVYNEESEEAEATDSADITPKAEESDELESDTESLDEPTELEEITLETDDDGYFILDADLVNEDLEAISITAVIEEIEESSEPTEPETDEDPTDAEETAAPEESSESEDSLDSEEPANSDDSSEPVESSDSEGISESAEIVENAGSVESTEPESSESIYLIETDDSAGAFDAVKADVSQESVGILKPIVHVEETETVELSDVTVATLADFETKNNEIALLAQKDDVSKTINVVVGDTLEWWDLNGIPKSSDNEAVAVVGGTAGLEKVKAVGIGVAIVDVEKNKKPFKVKVIVAPKTYAVEFKKNFYVGGSGNPPASIQVEQGDFVTLPEKGSLDRSGHTFMGWSKKSNCDNSATKKNDDLYLPGSQIKIDRNTTLYAIWAENSDVFKGKNVQYYIRLDGNILSSDLSTDSYTDLVAAYPAKDTLLKPIYIEDATGAKVVANINNGYLPTEDQIQKAVRKKPGLKDKFGEPVDLDKYDYDVVWYICKKQGDGWHVDGALVRRDVVKLFYDVNTSVNYTGDVPPGVFKSGTTEYVADATYVVPGYDFICWTTEKDGSGTSYKPGDLIEFSEPGYYYLYAQWQLKGTVRIAYKIAEGSGSLTQYSEDLNPDLGKAQGSTATPAAGYTFEGWYADEACTEKISEANNFIPLKEQDKPWIETTYYAKFKEEANVEITYTASAGGSVSRSSEILAPATGEAQGSIATAGEGFEFVNWTDADGNVVGEEVKFIPAKVEDLNVAATYTANFKEKEIEKVTIAYKVVTVDGNGGASVSAGGTVSLTSEALYADATEAQGSTAAAVDGYMFVGWYSDPDCQDLLEQSARINPAKSNGCWNDKTYYAKFEKMATIKYEIIGGDESVGLKRRSEAVAFETGEARGSYANPGNDYIFLGWYSDESCSANSLIEAKRQFIPVKPENGWCDKTYYAKFEKAAAIKYVIIGDEGSGSISTTEERVLPSSGVACGSHAKVNTGYVFAGWYSDEKCENKVSDSVKFVPEMPSGGWSDIVYYVKFDRQATITYEIAGVEGSGSLKLRYETIDSKTGIAEGSYASAKEGYVFVGWYSDKECSSESFITTNKKLELNKPEGGWVSTSYYAKFEPAAVITYTIVSGKDSGNVSKTSEIIAVESGVAQGSYALPKPGYTFNGWYYDQECTNLLGNERVITPSKPDGKWQNVTYYAKFEKDFNSVDPFAFIVTYYKDGQLVEADNRQVTIGDVWSGDHTYEVDLDDIAPDEKYPGYKLDSTNPPVINNKVTVERDAAIRVNYVKDEQQTKELSYTVKYYKDGSYVGQREVVESVWAGKQVVDFDKSIYAPEHKYHGYSLDATKTLPEAVSDGEVVSVYYVTDLSELKSAKYIVKHVVDNIEKSSKTYFERIWDGARNPKITIKEGTLEPMDFVGYKLDAIRSTDETVDAVREGISVASGTVITLIYAKDDQQTKELSYKVEYYKDGELVADDILENQTVAGWAGGNTATIAKETVVNFAKVNKYPGCSLDRQKPIDPAPDGEGAITITADGERPAVIKVYYVTDSVQTKDLSYTVEYYKDGVKVDTDTQTVTANVQVLQPDTLTVKKDDINITNKYEGYKFEKTEPAAIPETINDGGIIKVYYVIDESKTKELSYTVEYYQQNLDGVGYTKVETKTLSGVMGETVNAPQKTYKGFTFNSKAPGTKVSGTIEADGSLVLKLYYDRNTYTITYTDGVQGETVFQDRTFSGIKHGAPTPSFEGTPTRAGYTFTGWSPSVANTVTGTVTYAAQWRANTYTVSYNYIGDVPAGAPAVPASRTYTYGQTVTVAPNPSLQGYIFSGWDRAGSFTMPNRDVTITGFWTASQVPYRVEYYFQNTTDNGYSLYRADNLTGRTGAHVEAPGRTYTGLTHVHISNSVELGTIKADGSTVLRVYYNRDTYTVIYQYTGNAPSGATQLPDDQIVRYGQIVYVAPNATAPGYTFSGWDRTGSFTMPASDILISGSFETNPIVPGGTVTPDPVTPNPPTPSTPTPNPPVVPTPIPPQTPTTPTTNPNPTPGPTTPTATPSPASIVPSTPNYTPVAPAAQTTPVAAVGQTTPTTLDRAFTAGIDPLPTVTRTETSTIPQNSMAETIEEDATPMAAPSRKPMTLPAIMDIPDTTTPMAAPEGPHCWVHIWMIIGLVLTVIYGIVAVLRRKSLTKPINDYEDDVLRQVDDTTSATVSHGYRAA